MSAGVPMRTLPRFQDLVVGRSVVNELREIFIEDLAETERRTKTDRKEDHGQHTEERQCLTGAVGRERRHHQSE